MRGEGVVMGLQRLGDADLGRLLDLASAWAVDPDPLVKRAAVACVCGPRFLRSRQSAARATDLCERLTLALADRPRTGNKDGCWRTLRQALGYCWSVAVAADPAAGLPRFAALADYEHPDVVWVARENSKKARLTKLLR